MSTNADVLNLPEGWLSEREAHALADFAQDKNVLEIGSWQGRSTVAMARTAKLVVAVDHHNGSPEHILADGSRLDTFAAFIHNIRAYGVADRVVPVVASSRDVLPLLHSVYDMAFIDAAHDAINVLHDGRAAALLCRSGAPVVFHDYGSWAGVTGAVDELSKRWGRRVVLVPQTTLAVIYKA